MKNSDFQCQQCGKCCEHFACSATEKDIIKWKINRRWDILKWVDILCMDLWISPITHEETIRCPWLRKQRGKNKYYCRIHDVKPEVCHNFPDDREHAKSYTHDKCQGL